MSGDPAPTLEGLRRLAEELERSNGELVQFAHLVSHDLKAPLRTVASFAELLRRRLDTGLDPQSERYLELIVEGARQMAALIDDVLAWSKLGELEPQLGAVDMNAALSSALSALEGDLRRSGASVDFEELPVVRADATQMVRLLSNLIENAVRFQREQPSEIGICAEEEGGRWRFCISDDGRGFAMGDAERIFLPFVRMEPEEAGGGVGLGLAICQRIVERHGGKIWATSTPGAGSRFFFSLEKA